MNYFISGTLILLCVVAWVYVFLMALSAYEENGREWVIYALIALLSLGWVIGKIIESEQSGPCVQCEIQMRYNPATETVMPAKVCVNHGEWIEQ